MKTALFILMLFMILSCKKNDNNLEFEIDKNALSIEKDINISGGGITLDNIIDLRFSHGIFERSTKVKVIKSTNDNSMLDLYNSSAALFGAKNRATYFIKINVGSSFPKGKINATLNIPSELTNTKLNGYKYEVMALIDQSGQDESIINFEPIKSSLNLVENTLDIEIFNYYFDNSLTIDGSWEAVLAITTMPGTESSGRIKSDEDCAGFYIRCPLGNCTVTSKFDLNRLHPVKNKIAPHFGVDFRAASNTPVYAAYRGTVTQIREEKNAKGEYKGYGKYITIEHTNDVGQRIATRYAHLNSFNVKEGDFINEGDQIALSGNTGIGTAPHLHFEYAINATVGNYNQRINPMPFVNTTSVRLLSAYAKLTGINNCQHSGVINGGSTWDVTFDFLDPSNKITNNAIFTFRPAELNVIGSFPEFTARVGNLKKDNGIVSSQIFCAHFGDLPYFKIKVFITVEGVSSNCIVFYLNKGGNAARISASDRYFNAGKLIISPFSEVQ